MKKLRSSVKLFKRKKSQFEKDYESSFDEYRKNNKIATDKIMILLSILLH